MQNSILFAPAPAGDPFDASEPEPGSRETHDTDDHCCFHCGGTGFDSGWSLEEADQPMPCMFCDGTGRSDGTGEPARVLGGHPDPAPVRAAHPEADPLSAYLIELCENHYMPETVISRMRDLHAWRRDCPGCDSMERLHAYLDGMADVVERVRNFVAIRSYVRWLTWHGHSASDWTVDANVRKIYGGNRGE